MGESDGESECGDGNRRRRRVLRQLNPTTLGIDHSLSLNVKFASVLSVIARQTRGVFTRECKYHPLTPLGSLRGTNQCVR